MIDDESLVKTRTNSCLSETSGIPSYSVTERRFVFKCYHDNTIFFYTKRQNS